MGGVSLTRKKTCETQNGACYHTPPRTAVPEGSVTEVTFGRWDADSRGKIVPGGREANKQVLDSRHLSVLGPFCDFSAKSKLTILVYRN